MELELKARRSSLQTIVTTLTVETLWNVKKYVSLIGCKQPVTCRRTCRSLSQCRLSVCLLFSYMLVLLSLHVNGICFLSVSLT